MVVYSFQDEQGREVDVDFALDERPALGEWIEHEGQRLQRILSAPAGLVKEYRHVSHQLPRIDPKNPYWDKFNEKHQPVFEHKRDVDELSAKISHWGGNQVWT